MSAPADDAIRVLIVDDHEIVAQGLRALLDDDDRIDVVGHSSTLEQARTDVEALDPHVALVDYRLPDGNGIDFMRSVSTSNPELGIVMITAQADRRTLSHALEAGCHGFLSKNADSGDLTTAVVAARRGESHFTPDVVRHLSHLKRYEIFDADELSPREVEVLQLSAEGRTPEEIGEELFLSLHTVRNHIRHAMTKLQAHTKLEAVVKAARLRLISIDD